MLAVVSSLFFYKNIARLLLRNFTDNCHTNLEVFTVCEDNYLDQFCNLIKKLPE